MTLNVKRALPFLMCSDLKRSRYIQNQNSSCSGRREFRLFVESPPKGVVGVSMVVKYTPKYPDEIPNICFVDAVNISDDDIINLTQMIYVLRHMQR